MVIVTAESVIGVWCLSSGLCITIAAAAVESHSRSNPLPTSMAVGGWIQTPAKFFLYGMAFMCIGICLWVFAILEIDVEDHNYFYVLVVTCCGVGFPGAYFALNLVSSIWLTIANGEKTIEEGHAKSRRVQSITVDELKYELEKYVADAQGVENIDLATFKFSIKD